LDRFARVIGLSNDPSPGYNIELCAREAHNDNTDPMVSMMKVDKAPLESYSDIGKFQTFHNYSFFIKMRASHLLIEL
jgi:N6-L-threonylcarbamoyladenine synthase